MTRFWDQFTSAEEAEKKWDELAQLASKKSPLKVLQTLPNMPGIEKETAKFLHWKSLKWMITKDENFKVMKYIFKKPLTHTLRYFRSLFKKKSYIRDGDFFLYGIDSVEAMKKEMEDPSALLVVGFSYCEKPHECPSGRFTDACIHDLSNPVCQQCFIGKAVHALPEERTIPLFIPTIHYIGEKIFEIIEKNPTKKILFLITACELTLEMFGDFGNL